MAQWVGQYSGHTHDTKANDAEQLLRDAITALSNAPAFERPRRAKSVQKLSERLLAARLKTVRAKLAALAEPNKRGAVDEQAVHLLVREQELVAGGTAGVLKELGATESIR